MHSFVYALNIPKIMIVNLIKALRFRNGVDVAFNQCLSTWDDFSGC